MKFKFINQLESNDCGPACLSMILNNYGFNYSLKKIKEVCSISRMGVSVNDIIEGAEKFGLESYALKLSLNDLKDIPLPAILHWKQDHYIVLFDIKKKKYLIADPGYGKIKIDEDVIIREWIGNDIKGICLVFQPKDDIKYLIKEENEKNSFFSRKNEIINHFFLFIGNNKKKYILSFILLLIGLSANWTMPILFKKIIDDGIISKSLNLVIILLIFQFVLFVSNFIAQFFSDLVLTKLNFNLSISLKDSFLNKLLKLPINYFDTRLNTETLQRLTDLSKLQTFITWKGISFIINILNLLIFSIILLFLNKLIFFIFLSISLLSIIWISFFLKKRAQLEYSMFIKQSDNSNNMYEFIMNMPEIKVNQAQNAIISKILSLQKSLNRLELKSLFLNTYQLSGANFILKFKEIIIIALCAYFIINSKMSIGTFLSISYIMGQLNVPIINLINNIRDVQDAQISKKRVEDVFTTQNEIIPSHNSLNNFILNDLHLNNVSFKYPGSFNPFILNNLSFVIPKNKITAIVGGSGSGKTTLMKLLMLYYKPNAGSIMVGDTNINRINHDKWRQKCGVVLQDGNIFSGTFLYNICLSDNHHIDLDRYYSSIKIACLDDFISSLPLEGETKIGNSGIQLSGGQKQRVLIARAIYKNPDFIFFDEATSSLDANTEKLIINNLKDFFKGRTVVIIAHRLSTVKNADQIIVIDKGEIKEQGTHESLVNIKNKYYNLVKNQLELGN